MKLSHKLILQCEKKEKSTNKTNHTSKLNLKNKGEYLKKMH